MSAKGESFRQAIRRRAAKQLRLVRELSGSPDVFGLEGVHDMRVALRRFRSLARIAQARGDSDSKKLAKGARALALAFGQVRDLDVLIERIRTDSEQGLLAPEAAGPWLAKLHEDRHRAMEKARQALEDGKAAEWWDAARAWAQAKSAGDSIEEVLPEMLLEHIAAIEKLGSVSSESEIHEMRIEGKRLRYLLEFFESSVFAARRTIERLVNVQDDLGDFRDRQIAAQLARAEGLDEYAARLKEGATNPMAACTLARETALELAARVLAVKSDCAGDPAQPRPE